MSDKIDTQISHLLNSAMNQLVLEKYAEVNTIPYSKVYGAQRLLETKTKHTYISSDPIYPASIDDLHLFIDSFLEAKVKYGEEVAMHSDEGGLYWDVSLSRPATEEELIEAATILKVAGIDEDPVGTVKFRRMTLPRGTDV